jgi:hypothetical protein
MRQLALAETVGAVDTSFHQMYSDGRPGFQISPDVAVEDCLEILQSHMRARLGISDFSFNVAFGTIEPEGIAGIRHSHLKGTAHDSGPHIDEPEARRNLGIVLHDNRQGIGRVTLQLARCGVIDLDSQRLSRLPGRGPAASRKFEGKLFPGVKTVFSEGLVAATGLVKVQLGATIHDFVSDDEYREWVRFGWEPTIRN